MTYRTSKPLHPTEFGGPEKTFRSAFSSAKKSGKKTFKHKGKSYTTQTAAEKAKKQSYDNMVKSWKSSGKNIKRILLNLIKKYISRMRTNGEV